MTGSDHPWLDAVALLAPRAAKRRFDQGSQSPPFNGGAFAPVTQRDTRLRWLAFAERSSPQGHPLQLTNVTAQTERTLTSVKRDGMGPTQDGGGPSTLHLLRTVSQCIHLDACSLMERGAQEGRSALRYCVAPSSRPVNTVEEAPLSASTPNLP